MNLSSTILLKESEHIWLSCRQITHSYARFTRAVLMSITKLHFQSISQLVETWSKHTVVVQVACLILVHFYLLLFPEDAAASLHAVASAADRRVVQHIRQKEGIRKSKVSSDFNSLSLLLLKVIPNKMLELIPFFHFHSHHAGRSFPLGKLPAERRYVSLMLMHEEFTLCVNSVNVPFLKSTDFWI